MVATTSRRPNADTFSRWDAALKRAVEKGVQLFQHDATGQWFATSSNGTSMYAVTHYTCECQAALANDPVCLHRALFREACLVEDHEVEVLLDSAAPLRWEPVAPHPDVPTGLNPTDDVRCRRCGYLYEVAEIDDWTDGRATCTSCLTIEETGDCDAQLDGNLAEPTVPMTFDELDRMMEGATVLSVPAGSQRVETIPAPAPVRQCTDCLGTGIARMYTGGRGNEWVPVTCGCQSRAAA